METEQPDMRVRYWEIHEQCRVSGELEWVYRSTHDFRKEAMREGKKLDHWQLVECVVTTEIHHAADYKNEDQEDDTGSGTIVQEPQG